MTDRHPTEADQHDRAAWQLRDTGMSWHALAAEFGEPIAFVKLRCRRYEATTDAAAIRDQGTLF